MTRDGDIGGLQRSVEGFTDCIRSLADELFLRKIRNWTPRDVVAHLIGWNRFTIKGCEELRRGQTPFYFLDSGEDFSKVNAASVEHYTSRNREELLVELDRSFRELRAYLLELDSADWEKDFGVRYREHPVTIRNTIRALARDYVHHGERLHEWSRTRAGPVD